MSSGESKSEKNKNGVRRVVGGKELAPKSARRKGKTYLAECTENELKHAQIDK